MLKNIRQTTGTNPRRLQRGPNGAVAWSKEEFTLNSAARPLRIRVYSTEPSVPRCLVNIFFRASVCLFFPFPSTSRRSQEYAKRSSTPSASFFLYFFLFSFFFFASTHRPLLSSPLLDRFLIRTRRNYAGFVSGNVEGRERGGAENKIKTGVTRSPQKKNRERSFFFAHFRGLVTRLTASSSGDDFNASLVSHSSIRFSFLLFFSTIYRPLKNRLLPAGGLFFDAFFANTLQIRDCHLQLLLSVLRILHT